GMTSHRRIRCIVDCWWETPSASVAGTVTGRGDLSDTAIYYRNAGIVGANWSILPVSSAGRFSLAFLEPGAYWFRPASPNRHFSSVPRRVSLAPGRNTLEPFVAADRAVSLPEWTDRPVDSTLPSDAYSELTHRVLTFTTDPSVMGVRRNELGYEEHGALMV